MRRQVHSDEIEQVFEAWRKRQARPDACRLTEDRRDLIRWRLGLGYEVDDLLTLFRYAAESDDAGPRWWRGDNPTRKRYTDLDHLLRRTKLAGRIEAAHEWARGLVERETESLFGRFRLVPASPDEPVRTPEQAPAPASAGDLFGSLSHQRRGGVR